MILKIESERTSAFLTQEHQSNAKPLVHRQMFSSNFIHKMNYREVIRNNNKCIKPPDMNDSGALTEEIHPSTSATEQLPNRL